MEVVDLAAPVDLPLDGPRDHALVVEAHVRLDRVAVARRGLDDGDVPHSRERHLQGARDGSGAEGEHVHPHLEPAQSLLLGHAEALFLVHDHQAQVLGPDVLRQQPVGADENVHAAGGEVLEDPLLLRRRPEAGEHLHLHREVREPLPEGAVVLLGEDGGRHQDHDLLAVQAGFERGPQSDLGLAVAHVAAEEPVHGLAGLHVVLHGVDGPQLVLRLVVGKGLLEAHLPFPVLGEAVAGGGLAERVEVQQLAGHLAGGLAHPALDVLPGLAAQLGEGR